METNLMADVRSMPAEYGARGEGTIWSFRPGPVGVSPGFPKWEQAGGNKSATVFT
jgi:hypothetical protein